jgi:hypothetical protein
VRSPHLVRGEQSRPNHNRAEPSEAEGRQCSRIAGKSREWCSRSSRLSLLGLEDDVKTACEWLSSVRLLTGGILDTWHRICKLRVYHQRSRQVSGQTWNASGRLLLAVALSALLSTGRPCHNNGIESSGVVTTCCKDRYAFTLRSTSNWFETRKVQWRSCCHWLVRAKPLSLLLANFRIRRLAILQRRHLLLQHQTWEMKHEQQAVAGGCAATSV